MLERDTNRPECDLHSAIKYDREVLDKILNKEHISDESKYALADICDNLFEGYFECEAFYSGFERFLSEALGEITFMGLKEFYIAQCENILLEITGAKEEEFHKVKYLLMPESKNN